MQLQDPPAYKSFNWGRNSLEITVLTLHCKKWLTVFPSPVGMSLTKLFLVENNLIPGWRQENR
jgi:hypothetical protein